MQFCQKNVKAIDFYGKISYKIFKGKDIAPNKTGGEFL